MDRELSAQCSTLHSPSPASELRKPGSYVQYNTKWIGTRFGETCSNLTCAFSVVEEAHMAMVGKEACEFCKCFIGGLSKG
jgi:hypothetical protein